MQRFEPQAVSQHIQRIILPCGVCVYLVQGTNGAVLLDTGFGIGDLRSFVESLITTPYHVWLSHGHLDHAGGSAQFEEVFLSPADFALEKRHNIWQRRYDEIISGPDGAPADFTAQDLQPSRTAPYSPLKTNAVLKLGGVQVQAIPVPGHTAGMQVFLIPEDRVAIFGDACGEMTLLAKEMLPTYVAALRHLQVYQDQFDTVLRNHGAFWSDKRILQDNLELAEDIIAGRDAAAPLKMMGVSGFSGRPQGHPGKYGNIFYTAARNVSW